jgi:2-(3-amino-3-carboxypropyl)histidine synthase
MEDDREATNLGPEIVIPLNEATKSESVQPKRRFVGQRAAAKKAPANNGTIEESDAIQGSYFFKQDMSQDLLF